MSGPKQDRSGVMTALLGAAMLGTIVSVFTAGEWFSVWLGSGRLGLALAIVIDLGMLAAIMASRTDRAALWVVNGLAVVSWAANAQHAMMIKNEGKIPSLETWAATDYVTLLNALVVTAVAPVAAVALAWLYHRQERAAREEVEIETVEQSPPAWAVELRGQVGQIARVSEAVEGIGAVVRDIVADRAELEKLLAAPRYDSVRPSEQGRADAPMDRATALAMIRDGVFDHIPNKTQLATAIGVLPSTVSRWPIQRTESGWNVIQ